VASYGMELGLRYAKTFGSGLNLNGAASFATVKSEVLAIQASLGVKA